MAAVGAPSKVFYKVCPSSCLSRQKLTLATLQSEDKMKIHSPNAHRRAAALRSDYFYNYFTMGMVSAVDSKDYVDMWPLHI